MKNRLPPPPAPPLGLLAAPVLWLLFFLVLPAGVLLRAAFSREGLDCLLDPLTFALLGRSFRIAAAATALCLVAGYPAAYFIAGCAPRTRNLLLFLIVLPSWTNLLVRTYALLFLVRPILPQLLYSEAMVVFGLFHAYLPFLILPVQASIEKLPPRYLEAARDLGASPWQAFFRVTLPLTMPGVAAGTLLVFVPILGAFAIPEVLGGAQVPMIGSQIDLCFGKLQRPAAGGALTLILLAFTAALAWPYFRLRKSEGLV